MPIYPDLKLIFVHIPKTGGGTISTLMRPFEHHSRPSLARRATAHLPFAEAVSRVHIGTHDSAAWIRRKIGGRLWREWHSFTVVRDPYDRAISEFEYLRQTPGHRRHAGALGQSFVEFLAAEPRRRSVQSALLVDTAGHLLVKEIARFETLGEDVNAILERQGVSVSLDTVRRNTSVKKDRDHYLTDEAVAIINRRNADDFRLLGYPML